ncbi:MAG TPA: SRPBCC family protein [Chitinophagaceae bacterium]|nr:SRPBCC family protein [Chitinophagaceae bacterium]
MENKNQIYAGAQMLIRKPVEQVFEAFIDPAITKNFWFTSGSGRLEPDKRITWKWEMYNVSTAVVVKELEKNRRILIEWGEPHTKVDFNFQRLIDGSTYVTIRNYGFDKTGDELIEVIRDSTGGFTTVLDGLKAFLEYNINLNLVADKYPKEVMQHGN